MGINLNNGFEELMAHNGHRIVIVTYGSPNDVWNIAIECETCDEVLIDFENPLLNAEPDNESQEVIDRRWAEELQESSGEIDWDDDLKDIYSDEFDEDEDEY